MTVEITSTEREIPTFSGQSRFHVTYYLAEVAVERPRDDHLPDLVLTLVGVRGDGARRRIGWHTTLDDLRAVAVHILSALRDARGTTEAPRVAMSTGFDEELVLEKFSLGVLRNHGAGLITCGPHHPASPGSRWTFVFEASQLVLRAAGTYFLERCDALESAGTHGRVLDRGQ